MLTGRGRGPILAARRRSGREPDAPNGAPKPPEETPSMTDPSSIAELRRRYGRAGLH